MVVKVRTPVKVKAAARQQLKVKAQKRRAKRTVAVARTVVVPNLKAAAINPYRYLLGLAC
jgi:hypothetical protein